MIKFVKPEWDYDSYVDFWRLVELEMLPYCSIKDVDLHNKDITYILTPYNGEWKEFMDGKTEDVQAELVLWNLERPGGSGGLGNYTRSNMELIDAGYFHRIIVSDRNLANDTGFHFVPLGTHEGLGGPISIEKYKTYDLIHLSCFTHYRSMLFSTPETPRKELLGLRIAPNAWGKNRNRFLLNSKAMLSVHQDGLPYCEPLRLSLASAYGLILIWEECDTFPYHTRQFSLGALRSQTGLVEVFSEFREWLLGRWFEDIEDNFLECRKYMLDNYTFYKCLKEYL